VFAGAVTSAAIWLLLHLLGAAIGLSALGPRSETLRTVGKGAGIWALIVPLVALFIGGIIAGRSAGPVTRGRGAVHGIVVWSLTTVVAMATAILFGGSLVGGATQVGGAALGAAGKMGAAATEGASATILTDELIAPINQKMRAAGREEITIDRVREPTNDAVQSAIVGGSFDRDALSAQLQSRANLARDDADQLAASIEKKFNDQTASIAAAAGGMGRKAHGVALMAGKGAFWMFASMILSLVCAILGAGLGVGREQRTARVVTARTITTGTTPSPTPSV
jgi:hypothetical protein